MHDALDAARVGARHLLYEAALRTTDGTLIGGGLSSPLWWQSLDLYGHAALIVIAVIVGGLRVAQMVRDLRRPE